MVTSTGTQSSYDYTTTTTNYYVESSSSTMITMSHPNIDKGDIVKLRDINYLLQNFHVDSDQKEDVIKNQDTVFEVISIIDDFALLDKKVWKYDEEISHIHIGALYKVSKKELFMSKMKLNEELFQI